MDSAGKTGFGLTSFREVYNAYNSYNLLYYSEMGSAISPMVTKVKKNDQNIEANTDLIKEIKIYFKSNLPFKNPFIIFNKYFPVSYTTAIQEMKDDKTFISKKGLIFFSGCKQFDLPKELIFYILGLHSLISVPECDDFQKDVWIKMTLENPKLLEPISIKNKSNKKIFKQINFVAKPQKQEKNLKIKFWK